MHLDHLESWIESTKQMNDQHNRRSTNEYSDDKPQSSPIAKLGSNVNHIQLEDKPYESSQCSTIRTCSHSGKVEQIADRPINKTYLVRSRKKKVVKIIREVRTSLIEEILDSNGQVVKTQTLRHRCHKDDIYNSNKEVLLDEKKVRLDNVDLIERQQQPPAIKYHHHYNHQESNTIDFYWTSNSVVQKLNNQQTRFTPKLLEQFLHNQFELELDLSIHTSPRQCTVRVQRLDDHTFEKYFQKYKPVK